MTLDQLVFAIASKLQIVEHFWKVQKVLAFSEHSPSPIVFVANPSRNASPRSNKNEKGIFIVANDK